MVAERMQVEQVAMAAGKLALVAGELLLSDTGLRQLREDGSPDFTLREAASLAEDAWTRLQRARTRLADSAILCARQAEEHPELPNWQLGDPEYHRLCGILEATDQLHETCSVILDHLGDHSGDSNWKPPGYPRRPRSIRSAYRNIVEIRTGLEKARLEYMDEPPEPHGDPGKAVPALEAPKPGSRPILPSKPVVADEDGAEPAPEGEFAPDHLPGTAVIRLREDHIQISTPFTPTWPLSFTDALKALGACWIRGRSIRTRELTPPRPGYWKVAVERRDDVIRIARQHYEAVRIEGTATGRAPAATSEGCTSESDVAGDYGSLTGQPGGEEGDDDYAPGF